MSADWCVLLLSLMVRIGMVLTRCRLALCQGIVAEIVCFRCMPCVLVVMSWLGT